jgi:hypothetical protein
VQLRLGEENPAARPVEIERIAQLCSELGGSTRMGTAGRGET